MFYECMLLSPVDKVFEFNEKSMFFNMVMSRDYIDDEPLIIRIIRKSNIAVIVVKEFETDKFKIIRDLVKRFKFQKVVTSLETNSLKLNNNNNINSISENPDESNSMFNSVDDMRNAEMAQGEI